MKASAECKLRCAASVSRRLHQTRRAQPTPTRLTVRVLRCADRDRVVRRGLALIIESDFYATDAGRQHFADQLTSIRYCVQETCSARRTFNQLSPTRRTPLRSP